MYEQCDIKVDVECELRPIGSVSVAFEKHPLCFLFVLLFSIHPKAYNKSFFFDKTKEVIIST